MILTLIMMLIVAAAWLAVAVLPPVVAGLASRTIIAINDHLDRDESAIARRVPNGWAARLLDLPLIVLLAIPLVLGLWLFFGILEEVAEGDSIVDLDKVVFEFLRSLRSAPFDRAMIAITGLGDAHVVMPVTLAGLVALAGFKRWRAALYLMTATAGAAIFVAGVKRVIQRPRPVAIYDGLAEYSFPSGHACMSVVLYGFLAMLLVQAAVPGWRRVIAFATLLLIAMISFSRLYLGAHWLSDVAAGIAFGIAWIALLTILYLRHDAIPAPAPVFASVLLAAFVIAGYIHTTRDLAKETTRYAVPNLNSKPRP
ncbi:MAG: phosphatase PAP2 family protein [Hyphomicrobiaceae bacterium]